MSTPSASPFSQSTLTEFGEYTKRGTHTGLLLKDGRILINFNDSTHHSFLVQIADAIGAELISVSGTWTFKPDDTTEFKKIARRRS